MKISELSIYHLPSYSTIKFRCLCFQVNKNRTFCNNGSGSGVICGLSLLLVLALAPRQ